MEYNYNYSADVPTAAAGVVMAVLFLIWLLFSAAIYLYGYLSYEDCQKNRYPEWMVCLDSYFKFCFNDTDSQKADVVDNNVFHTVC